MIYVSLTTIPPRLKNLGKPSNLNVNYTNLVVKIIDRLYDNIKTTKIDELTAEQCASLTTNPFKIPPADKELLITFELIFLAISVKFISAPFTNMGSGNVPNVIKIEA